jgi:ubiquinone/menaquinone biosynthesis C-methylase UbiE/DNA-binding transcriptional ArsR family regulator
MDELLVGLRAAAEPTRLRILALLAEGEMTVSELTQVLGQSQPRVSRHLKLMCDARLLDRFPEGRWVFHRLADRPGAASAGNLARMLAAMVPDEDPQLARDRDRLRAVKKARAAAAASYFAANAERWDEIRSLYVDEREVEAALARVLPADRIDALLDIGTGTGRVLEVLGPQVLRGVGVDLSRDMLSVARARLEAAGLAHCHVRQGDMYALPMTVATFDAVTLHLVLHFADRPGAAIAEAARVLRPGGRVVIVDFAPHRVETLRDQHAHRRLGFSDDEIAGWCRAAGLAPAAPVALPGNPLTVKLWPADRPLAAPARRAGRARGQKLAEEVS